MNRVLVALTAVCVPMLSVAAPPIVAPVDVNVTNPASTPALVRDVDSSAREPFQATIPFVIFGDGGIGYTIMTVPSDKALVIEHVSALINVNSTGGLNSAFLYNSGFDIEYLPCQNTGSTSNDLNHFFACSVQTQFYASSGQTIGIGVYTAAINGTGAYKVLVSGHYIPVASAPAALGSLGATGKTLIEAMRVPLQ